MRSVLRVGMSLLLGSMKLAPSVVVGAGSDYISDKDDPQTMSKK
jgi:hypothetical protein